MDTTNEPLATWLCAKENCQGTIHRSPDEPKHIELRAPFWGEAFWVCVVSPEPWAGRLGILCGHISEYYRRMNCTVHAAGDDMGALIVANGDKSFPWSNLVMVIRAGASFRVIRVSQIGLQAA